MEKNIRIVYMGTPDFAVAPLARLIEEGYQVVGVVTMPDKAIGRHHDQLQASPVKQYALGQGIPVLQPERLRDETFLQQLQALRADLQIVVAFRMLPEVVWAMPPMGTFNLHAALLPQYRGAAPINWAVINGDTETGVTTFFLDHDIDTGRIILQERIPIHPEDNAGTIHDRMMEVGSALVLRTVEEILAGTARAVPQDRFLTDQPLRHAPKIFRETCQIRWNEHTAESAHNLVRGLSPYPAAWATLTDAQGRQSALKIYRTALTGQPNPGLPVGTIRTDGKTHLHVALPDALLALEEVQLAGKKRMSVADFLRGTRLEGCMMQ